MRQPLMWLCGAALIGAAHAQTTPPPTFDLAAIEKGREQYHRTCAQCHGRNMVNAGTTVYDLRRFPQDQPDRFIQSVVNGKGNMPSFKDALDMQAVQALWAYVGSRGGKEP
ncbi:c-type cytochrome [Hydrogenophaga sp.]|uniref:c-type cytochrome n=1 Tax=Hydrogenophaga sp. TaxID=1904254 RepID=UPI003AF69F40